MWRSDAAFALDLIHVVVLAVTDQCCWTRRAGRAVGAAERVVAAYPPGGYQRGQCVSLYLTERASVSIGTVHVNLIQYR